LNKRLELKLYFEKSQRIYHLFKMAAKPRVMKVNANIAENEGMIDKFS
jgi:hypothetical protein